MPLVRNTETGNYYLEKINTGGDACSKGAIRSYDKQLGIEGVGTVDNTEFTLPFAYLPGTHTLWVYINGQKAEYISDTDPSLPGDAATFQHLIYNEPSNKKVIFYYPLEDDDIVEFIVIGAYEGAVNDTLVPEMTRYKTTFDNGIVDGITATNFDGDQKMSGAGFTGMRKAITNGESVSYEQSPYYDTNQVHYHIDLRTLSNSNVVLSTTTGQVDVRNNKIINLAAGSLVNGSTDGINADQLYDHSIKGATASVWGHVKLSLVSGVLTITGG